MTTAGSARLLRIEWLPGSDRLLGCCHCGAEIEAEDPIVVWEWLLAHPVHPGGTQVPEPPVELPPPPPHLVTDPAQILRRVPVLV